MTIWYSFPEDEEPRARHFNDSIAIYVNPGGTQTHEFLRRTRLPLVHPTIVNYNATSCPVRFEKKTHFLLP
jgi:hypothetical protein